MKTSTLRKMAVMLLCIPLLMSTVSAITIGTKTIGTAKADNVLLYEQTDFKANGTLNGTGTLSYRVVNVGDKMYAFYKVTTVDPLMTITNADWAAQLRNFGVDGATANRKEMNLDVRNTANTQAYNNTALFHAADPAYYTLRSPEEQVSVQFQNFISFSNGTYLCSNLFTYASNTINNPGADTEAPVMSSASAAIDGNNITVTMNGTDNNEFFYYIYDAGNNLFQVSFTNTFSFPKSVSTLYALNVVAVDYDGNVSNVKTTYVETPFDTTVNLALNKAATAGGGTAASAVDGNTNTIWQAGSLPLEWLSVNLGSNGFNLKKLQIVWESAYSKSFELYTSMNGTDWTLAKTVTRTLASPNNYVEDIFFPYPAKYIKFVDLVRAIGYGAAIRELRAYGMGNYVEVTSPVLTSVLIDPVTIYAGITTPLVVIPKNQADGILTGATLGVTVTTSTGDPTTGVTIIDNGDGTFKATGVTAGTYTLTASATKDGVTATNTSAMVVTDAPRVTQITLTTPLTGSVYYKGQAIAMTVVCKDQYGATITNPTFVWSVTGAAAGAVTGTYNYTPTAKGTGNVKASFTNSIGTLVESNAIDFNVITDAANISKGKTVTQISTCTSALSPSPAIDDNNATQWIVPDVPAMTDHSYPAWIIIDLGAKYKLELIDILWEGAFSKTYTVEYSDDNVTFTPQITITNNTVTSNKYSTNLGSTRYVKINSSVAGTQYGVKILDTRIFGVLDLGTATQQVSLSSSVVYPNPATDRVNITGNVANVAFYSMQGQLVQSVANRNSVDVSSFAKGLYFVRVTDKAGNQQSSKLEIK